MQLGRPQARLLDDLDDPLGSGVPEDPDGDDLAAAGGGRSRRPPAAATWRGEGAKMKPTASAPIATASSASSSFVVPQILTKTWSPSPGEEPEGAGKAESRTG